MQADKDLPCVSPEDPFCEDCPHSLIEFLDRIEAREDPTQPDFRIYCTLQNRYV